MPYPKFERLVGLVYRECPCGQWCATQQGGFPPLCAYCGKKFMPPAQDNRRLGFVAKFCMDSAVDRQVGEDHDAFAHDSPRVERYFTEAEIEAAQKLREVAV